MSIGGAVDAVRAADIIVGRSLNYTPYIVAGLVFVALTIPMTRFTDWITARMDRQRAQEDHMTGTPVLRMESVRKTFGDSVVLRDVDLEVARTR